MIGGADCKFRAFDAWKCMEVQNHRWIWRDLSDCDGEMDRSDNHTPCRDYFFAGTCGWDGGTVSISLPENTGAEVGWPLGEPPGCSTVTA